MEELGELSTFHPSLEQVFCGTGFSCEISWRNRYSTSHLVSLQKEPCFVYSADPVCCEEGLIYKSSWKSLSKLQKVCNTSVKMRQMIYSHCK